MVRTRRPLTPAALVGPLVDELDRTLTAAAVWLAHLKVFDQTATGYLKASLCRSGGEPGVEGALDAAPARAHALVVNLRAAGAPERLLEIVDRAAAGIPGKVAVGHRQAFRPAAPRPEHRFSVVVTGETPG